MAGSIDGNWQADKNQQLGRIILPMQISRALRLDSTQITPNARGGKTIAFVGAGGKTTAMFQLARELQSKNVNRKTTIVITATTHLGVWQIPLADHHLVAETPEDIGGLSEGVILITGPFEAERTQPVNPDVLFWLREITQNKETPMLIEADGSRQKPLKAPDAHEPPIPDFVGMVIMVAGLSGLGKPITDEFVFRAERFRKIYESANRRIGASVSREIVTAEMLTRILTHPQGGLKNIPPHARRIALLNQAETPELQSIGGGMARDLLGHFDSVLVGSLHQNNFHTFEQTAGIILAAGESTRFGQPKQLLDWKGKPFVRQVAGTALQAGLWPVVVVTGSRAADVESALEGLPVNIVRNEDWKGGQGLSIAAGVRALTPSALSNTSPRKASFRDKATYKALYDKKSTFGRFSVDRGAVGSAIFLLADQPQVPAEVIRALVESHSRNLPAILAPLVLEEKRANPVLFDRVTFPDLLQLTGDVGGRAIFDKHKVEYLPWHDDALLLDVDTPEDYERLTGRNGILPHNKP